jgi:hypothetical protein
MASRTLTLGSNGATRFWFCAFLLALMPTTIGYQDVAALLAHQPAVPSHPSHRHLIASPFGTIEPTTYRYGIHPIGTAMPQPPAITLVNYDPRSVDAEVWSLGEPLREQLVQIDYPTVNRKGKSDRLPSASSAPPATTSQSAPQVQQANATPAAPPATPVASPAGPAPHAQAPAAPVAQMNSDLPPEVPAAGEIGASNGQSVTLDSIAFADEDADDRSAQLYFDTGVIGSSSGLEPWAPGAEPIAAPIAAPIMATPSFDGPGDDVASGKDESRVESPAQRLGLNGKARAKAEKCLADAVYFEARGEPLRGQEAVAQVVMNRVFSGYYPNNVCGVVYQNASHYLACQFTFACEHRDLSRIDEPDMWAQAQRIAKDELDGKIWLTDIGHATHYHAYWVHPSWVHEMTRLYKLGVHTFYRPRAWGNGDYEPVWGTPPNTSSNDQKPDAAKKPDGAAKGPQAEAAPAPAPAVASKNAIAKL